MGDETITVAVDDQRNHPSPEDVGKTLQRTIDWFHIRPSEGQYTITIDEADVDDAKLALMTLDGLTAE